MRELLEKHYGKLIAFLMGWAADAVLDLSAYIRALLP
jgi:hypothetical protein